ncbi:2550_t:CDS:1, partial [Rhizophagus irregularis]
EQTKEQHINNPTEYYQNKIYSNLPMQRLQSPLTLSSFTPQSFTLPRQ